MSTTALPIAVATDPEQGGRWTSLRAGGREWLWRRPGTARATVRPGDAFVDAGGLEECVPTVRGVPDHGDAWSRPWRRDGGVETMRGPAFALTRRIAVGGSTARTDYTLEARPGYRFIWAAHALLDAPEGTPTRVFPEAAGLLTGAWPPGATHVTGEWPAPCGLRLDRLGPDDGTALGAILCGCRHATVIDGSDTLSLRLRADPGVPVSLALWRNLRGFPGSDPYRSIGVEPMLGAVWDIAQAGARDAATVPADGELHWRLELTAARRINP